jgi:hypothetical protein
MLLASGGGGEELVVYGERLRRVMGGARDVGCGEKVLVFVDLRLQCPTMEKLIDNGLGRHKHFEQAD